MTGLPIRYVQCDISDPEMARLLPEKVDVIIHCAAVISYAPFSSVLLDVNCKGLQNIAEYANASGCRQFVFFSSIPIIGRPKYLPIDEAHPINPPTVYHLTKAFGESFLSIALKKECCLCVFRIPSPIGPRTPHGKIVPTLINNALEGKDIVLLGRGGRVQNYIDIDDIAEAVALVLEKPVAGLFNIASGKSYSNLVLARKCIDLFDSQSRIIFSGEDPDENVMWEISTAKAKEAFGFSAKTTLEESLLRMAEYYQR